MEKGDYCYVVPTSDTPQETEAWQRQAQNWARMCVSKQYQALESSRSLADSVQ